MSPNKIVAKYLVEDTGTRILKEGITDLVLKPLGISEVVGPPMAYFETGDGEQFHRYIYIAYRHGVAVDSESHRFNGDTRVLILGRFKEFTPLFEAVMADLYQRLQPGKPLIWRREPIVEIECGFYKAYMRFVQVPTQEIADEAAALANHRCKGDSDDRCYDPACPHVGKRVLL